MPDPSPELPLTETTLLILLSLSPGARHGYAIMKDVLALSDERVSLSTGTLYGALKRLLELGWIDRQDDPAAGETARERKLYALTDQGRHVLDAEVARLRQLVKVARARMVAARG